MSVIFENNKLKMKESVLTEEELQTYTELPNDDWLWNENDYENENEHENENENVTDIINDTLAIKESMERDKKKRDYETLEGDNCSTTIFSFRPIHRYDLRNKKVFRTSDLVFSEVPRKHKISVRTSNTRSVR